MKKSGLFLISIMVLAGFMVLASTTPTATAQDYELIEISAIEGQIAYDTETINVDPGVTYNITFTNPDPINGHNLKIDEDGDLSSSTVNDDDFLIGEADDDPAGRGPMSWSELWTAPDEDTTLQFYCGYVGHYDQGMFGDIVVGTGGGGIPGFTLFFALFSVFAMGVIISRFRKQ